MILTINGEGRETAQTTLGGLLVELGIEPQRVAVEVNLAIIKKADYKTFLLNEGDSIEIVNFVGGGAAPKRFK